MSNKKNDNSADKANKDGETYMRDIEGNADVNRPYEYVKLANAKVVFRDESKNVYEIDALDILSNLELSIKGLKLEAIGFKEK